MSFTFPSSPTLNQQYSVSGGPTYTWNGTAWIVLTPGQQFNRQAYTATANQTSFSVSTGYLVGGLDVFRNGVKLITGTDYTATNGSTFILILPANNGDTVECICYSQILYSDALRKTGDTMTGNLTVPNITSNGFVVANNGLYSSNNYTGTYTAGIVVDYVTGNGRISVGSGDGLTIYNGGVANTSLVTLNSSGNLTFNTASSVTFNNNTAISAASTKSLTLNGGAGTNGLVIGANNNVGIGTASPACPLDTNGMIRAISKVGAYPASGKGLEIYYESAADLGILLSYDRGATAYKPLTYVASTHTFSTSGTTRMTLDNAGNLGLGVTPSAWDSGQKVIQISNSSFYGYSSGTVVTQNVYYNSGHKYIVSSLGAAYYQQYGGVHQWYNAPSGTAGDAISFTQAMTLDASGRLGIGTTSPSTEGTNVRLAVVGGAGQQASSLATSNINAGFTVRANASSGYVLAIGATTNGSQPYIQGVNYNGGAASADLAIQPYGGNVGIGTSSPSYKLDVSGSVNISADNFYRIGAGTDRYIQYRSSNSDILYSFSTGNFYRQDITNSAHTWYTGNTERARIDSTGNFIVGTAALSTSATSGFHWIPSCAGTPTGAATPPYSGASGLVVDSTNGRLYVRSGSNWIGTNIGNATSTAIYSHYHNIASFTPSANATDWYRVVSFTGSNQPSFVRLHISIPGVHFQCLVDISRGAGGDFVQTQFKLLGNYVYWGQYPMDWRLVPTGTNLPTYLDVRFSAFTSGGISPVYIAVLESITTDSGHPTFPGTNVGTAAAGYGIRIGTTSGFTYPEFKIRPGVWAREDASFVRTTGTVASGAVQT